MTLSAYATLPSGILSSPTPFTFTVPPSEQNRLLKLAGQADIGVPSYYSTHTDVTNNTSFGISRDWLIHAQDTWTSSSSYSWRDEQRRLNGFPNFRINITASPTTSSAFSSQDGNHVSGPSPSNGDVFDIHFAALFSHKRGTSIPTHTTGPSLLSVSGPQSPIPITISSAHGVHLYNPN